MGLINFFTFKWGDKYGPEYVNRLLGSLRHHCREPFILNLISDNFDGVDNNITFIDYSDFDHFSFPKDKIFTREKLTLFKEFNKGINCWLDLDILIHDDIEFMFDHEFEKPKFIWNYWNNYYERSLKWYGKGSSCHVNSSFVAWRDNSGEYIYDYLYNNKEKAFFTYKSLDKFLFYQLHRKNKLDYWDKNIFNNYNKEGFIEKGIVTLFNTSHLYNNKGIKEKAYELHEAKGWVEDIWKSYY